MLVLLLGEIDLSVGSVSGLTSAILAVLNVSHGWATVPAILAALLAGAVIGLLHGIFFAKIGVPAFVVTLAGLIGWQGLQLTVLGDQGTINFDFNGGIAKLANTYYTPGGRLRHRGDRDRRLRPGDAGGRAQASHGEPAGAAAVRDRAARRAAGGRADRRGRT